MMAGRPDVAIELFRKFLSAKASLEADEFGNMLLKGRDIESAFRHAREL